MLLIDVTGLLVWMLSAAISSKPNYDSENIDDLILTKNMQDRMLR